ncbi:UNVERIFIED_CONTAM: hypothetical protein Sradi_5042900 [Sesamum radiatum]|uniref:Uncharacterized protein n=1 Tax=Sesamum radiatum TaxID=300843 RepID=A0AAW2MGY8_SESRA
MAGMSENKCSPRDITVKQNPTGTKVQGKPEFQVTVQCLPLSSGQREISMQRIPRSGEYPPNVLVVNGGNNLSLRVHSSPHFRAMSSVMPGIPIEGF